jgi:preprotein translocase subunit SecG
MRKLVSILLIAFCILTMAVCASSSVKKVPLWRENIYISAGVSFIIGILTFASLQFHFINAATQIKVLLGMSASYGWLALVGASAIVSVVVFALMSLIFVYLDSDEKEVKNKDKIVANNSETPRTDRPIRHNRNGKGFFAGLTSTEKEDSPMGSLVDDAAPAFYWTPLLLAVGVTVFLF